ncbi:MAG: hypothetical protein EB166_02410 [Thaumarchaeota archaeon]|nr:hypothetical protein [Nitrososphaerota archaeon]NDF46658.1 hypothetical protein [Nitrosopumilaceae archaeon]
MSQELPIIKKGSFYYLKDGPNELILEDRTKRGLTVREQTMDETYNVLADKGMIHDMDGIGHWVPIRWYYPKKDYDTAVNHAEKMEKKYTELRELTCPDDSD